MNPTTPIAAAAVTETKLVKDTDGNLVKTTKFSRANIQVQLQAALVKQAALQQQVNILTQEIADLEAALKL
jgi:hypothetical protein